MTRLEVQRYSTVSSIKGVGKLETYKYMFTGDDCESITDKSMFVPESEALRKLKSGDSALSASDMQYFDYPDGKENMSDKVPIARIKGADIAEISQEIKADQAKIKKEIDSQVQQKQAEQALQAKLDGLTSGSSSSASASQTTK